MKRPRTILLVCSVALVVALLAYRWHSDAGRDAERVYREYDLDFRTYLASAIGRVGKETIKVERLSDRFTVPQKLTIQGTAYDIGLTIGHIARLARAPLPLVAEADRAVNQQVADLYRRIYPQDLELVRGVAITYGVAAEEVDLRRFASEFTPQLWCGLLMHRRFYELTDFGKHGDAATRHHCSAASYFAGGHHLV